MRYIFTAEQTSTRFQNSKNQWKSSIFDRTSVDDFSSRIRFVRDTRNHGFFYRCAACFIVLENIYEKNFRSRFFLDDGFVNRIIIIVSRQGWTAQRYGVFRSLKLGGPEHNEGGKKQRLLKTIQQIISTTRSMRVLTSCVSADDYAATKSTCVSVVKTRNR